jgi:hypothetical protein
MLANVMANWSILRPFGIGTLWPFGRFHGYLVYFFPVLVNFTKKNLATLMHIHMSVGACGRACMAWQKLHSLTHESAVSKAQSVSDSKLGWNEQNEYMEESG